MKMFLGEYNPNITEGSRIALPKKHRQQLEGGEVVLAKGFEKCVLIYDKNDWIAAAQKQIDNPDDKFRTRNLERYMYTDAQEGSVDTQGRLVIPPDLRTYADLDGKTAVLGVGDHVEIWNEESWRIYSEKLAKEFSTQTY